MGDNAFYFKHDLNARNDPKIIPMRMKMGTEGYGAYCMIIEKLYEAKGRLPRDYAALSWELHLEQPKIKQLIESFGLFYDIGGKIASKRVDRELAERAAISEACRVASGKRWGGNAKAMPPHSNGSADGIPGEERRGEDRIGDITTANPPSAVDLSQNGENGMDGNLTDGDLLGMQFPYGARKGVHIANLPADEAAFILKKDKRLSAKLRRALELRVKIKADECR